jgi:hypothetical protein
VPLPAGMETAEDAEVGGVDEEEPHAASAAALRTPAIARPVRRGNVPPTPRLVLLVSSWWCSDLVTETPARRGDAARRMAAQGFG